MLVPHQFVAVLLQVGFELLQSIAESRENLFHVAALLHRNDAQVVFLVHPDKEVFVLIVPNTTGVGPITSLKMSEIDSQLC